MTFYRPYKQKGCLATAFRCDSHRIQTCNLLIRSQMLYSVELANHVHPKNPHCGDSHRIQTCNLLIRSQMLYSVELANLLDCDPSQNHDAKLLLFFELCKF